MSRLGLTPVSTLINTPELNVAVFAMLLNLPWEFWQVPFFQPASFTADHWGAIKDCTRASLGDAAIAVGAFWVAAAAARSREWILGPRPREVAIFVLAGAIATVLLEWHATQVAGRWAYAPAMPVVPGLGVGILPVLQWIVLPPLVIWFVRRQLT